MTGIYKVKNRNNIEALQEYVECELNMDTTVRVHMCAMNPITLTTEDNMEGVGYVRNPPANEKFSFEWDNFYIDRIEFRVQRDKRIHAGPLTLTAQPIRTNCGALMFCGLYAPTPDELLIMHKIIVHTCRFLSAGMAVITHNENFIINQRDKLEDLGWVISQPCYNPNEGHNIHTLTLEIKQKEDQITIYNYRGVLTGIW